MERTWRRIMNNVKANPNVIQACSEDKLLESLRECNELLDTIQKGTLVYLCAFSHSLIYLVGLTQYLETKRAAFPRLYFLSNDELLQILSQVCQINKHYTTLTV